MSSIASTSTVTECPATTRLYYQNSYKESCVATVLSIGKDENGSYAICNQTIFHPQGGGQPSDIGFFKLASSKINVIKLTEDKKTGVIKHYFDPKELEQAEKEVAELVGKKVTQTIDLSKRILFAQQHTGGHLLANIVEALDPRLTGCNGYHFPEGPYVKFMKAEEEAKETKEAKVELNKNAKKAKGNSKADLGISFTADDVEKIAAKYIASSLSVFQDNEKMPRTVQIQGLKSYPCGGTHLGNIEELVSLTIRKMEKEKDGSIKIKYQVGKIG